MDREIKFRGKRLDSGKWEYGYLVIREQDVHGTPGYFLAHFGGEWIAVDPDTVGQFTGLKDKNGREVYEGNIVQLLERATYTVEWDKDIAGFVLYLIDGDDYDKRYHRTWNIAQVQSGEVIGNTHDNPKLLEDR